MLSGAKFVYKIAALRELERIAIATYHLDVDTLMHRAGKAALRELLRCYPHCKRICVVCGKGNNAGDGYVLALAARQAGLQVKILYLVAPDQLQGAALRAAMACSAEGLELIPYGPQQLVVASELIVDAILGTGLVGEVSAQYRQAINEINNAGLPILALDLPSGLDADSGKSLGAAIHATTTCTFLGSKIGFYLQDGPNYTGKILVDNLDLPEELYNKVPVALTVLDLADKNRLLPPRLRNASKFDFGYVLVIGGNYGMAGAARMAAEAALRVGAGMVNVITRPANVAIVTTMRPELMCRGFSWLHIFFNSIKSLLARATVVVLGPGLGKSWWSRILFTIATRQNQPMILDADALNLLALRPMRRDNWILTPHLGEAARLLHTTLTAVQGEMVGAAQAIQKKYGGVCVLKSARTLVAAGGAVLAVSPFGNPGMATAGMGDVLSGVIGGLLAQKLSLNEAACIGVALHGMAGDLAAAGENGERGLVAMDLMPYIQQGLSSST